MKENKSVFLKGGSVQTLIGVVMSRILSKVDFEYFAALTGVITHIKNWKLILFVAFYIRLL